MAGFQNLVKTAAVAGEDMSSKQYRIVQWTGDRQVKGATDPGEVLAGILYDAPAVVGHVATVITGGTCPCVAGDEVAAGDLITTDSEGRGVEAAEGENIVGVAKTGAANAGELFEVIVNVTYALGVEEEIGG